jgi:hypothetical protein
VVIRKRIKTRILGDTLYIEQEGVCISVNGAQINVVGNGCVIAGGDIYIGGNGRVRGGGASVSTASAKVVVGIALPEAPSFQVRGSADIVLQDLKQSNLDLSVRGSGDIVASGTVDILNVEIAGSGDVDASDLATRSANLSITGSGSIEAYVTQRVQGISRFAAIRQSGIMQWPVPAGSNSSSLRVTRRIILPSPLKHPPNRVLSSS